MEARRLSLGLNVAGHGYIVAVGWAPEQAVLPGGVRQKMVLVEFASERRKKYVPWQEVALVGDPDSPMSPGGVSKRRLIVIGRLIERDGARCFYCEESLLEPWLYTLDHWIPVSRGGKNTFSNYRLACASCNGAKADMMPEDFARVRPGKWTETIEEVA